MHWLIFNVQFYSLQIKHIDIHELKPDNLYKLYYLQLI